MFWNYLKIALRNLRKNKAYALINVGGLAIGLSIYLFGNLAAEYELTHDTFFAKSERIYTVSSVFVPGAGVGGLETPTAYSALKPIFDSETPDIEASARTIRREYVARHKDKAFYQTIAFADPELLSIFDFTYLQGSSDALDNPQGIVLIDTTAEQYFGRTDVAGEVITLSNEHEFIVTAVISIPENSHFRGELFGSLPIKMFASLKRLETISNFQNEGDWENLLGADKTYVLLPPSLDKEWFQTQLEGIYDRSHNENFRNTVSGFKAVPLANANLAVWYANQVPLPEIIKFLCLLVLIIACVNYANLAIAQSMGRSREIGMRKVVGAPRVQLLIQFLVESLELALVAMLIAVAVIELIIPIYNSSTGKFIQLNYLTSLPWISSTA